MDKVISVVAGAAALLAVGFTGFILLAAIAPVLVVVGAIVYVLFGAFLALVGIHLPGL